jgi:predicted deacetylase
MNAQYLLRFDDICPTMNWAVWERVEALLEKHRVNPILAVVPDNQDPVLVAGQSNPRFWERVRGWQSKGWSMGLHGYQHRFVATDAGIVGKNRYSEFAGLPQGVQEHKLRAAVELFAAEKIRPDVFVAPAHSFDRVTIDCLLRCGISCLSDGYALHPARDSQGIVWVPQQLWEFAWRPAGVWTVCLHLNTWGEREVKEFEKGLETFAGQITTLASVVDRYQFRSFSVADHVHELALKLRLKGGVGARSAIRLLRRTSTEL